MDSLSEECPALPVRIAEMKERDLQSNICRNARLAHKTFTDSGIFSQNALEARSSASLSLTDFSILAFKLRVTKMAAKPATTRAIVFIPSPFLSTDAFQLSPTQNRIPKAR